MISEDVRIISTTAKITVAQEDRIKDFLSGAIYAFCKNCLDEDGKSKWFGARDLVGGVNTDWRRTPLQCIHDWHEDNGSSDPFEMSARDIGHILKVVLFDDKKRKFSTRENYRHREYKWIEDLEIN